MENLTGMAIFARVVEAEGFSAAARQLGLSKSAVSKQVARLEDRLGARLLNRTTRRLSLTEVGAAFYERCARILAEAEAAERAVTRLQAEPRGTLRVNAPMSFGVRHVAPAIPAFVARYPDVSVDISLTDRLVDLVDEGYDLAIRIANLPDSSLVARRLAPARFVVCASPDYLARHGAPAQPRDLARHNCLTYSYAAVGDEWRLRGPDGEVRVRVTGTVRANNGDVLRAAALGGLGIVVMPTFLVGDALRSGALASVLPDYRVRETAIHAVYPHGRHLSAKVRAFVDFLVERFGPQPYWDAAQYQESEVCDAPPPWPSPAREKGSLR
jgi:DNA-binding transcriptional LysR family regulator